MSPLQRYSDRRVLITGAGSGIGQACVLRILDEGGRVVAAGAPADLLSQAAVSHTARELARFRQARDKRA